MNYFLGVALGVAPLGVAEADGEAVCVTVGALGKDSVKLAEVGVEPITEAMIW